MIMAADLGQRDFGTDDTSQELLGVLKTGRFTPFLGAGASSLRPAVLDIKDSPWQEIAQAISTIGEGLKLPEEILFLRSFARQRLRPSPVEVALWLPLPAAGSPSAEAKAPSAASPDWPSHELLALQRSVVRVATLLGDLFARTFLNSHCSVTSAADIAVSLPIAESESAGLPERLIEAADAAAGLDNASTLSQSGPRANSARYSSVQNAEPRVLETDGIYQKLLQLLALLVSRERWIRSAHSQSEPAATVFAKLESTATEILLRLDQLAWLSDLLWYTLRFWSPCYPTTSELAFELALSAFLTPPRKAELSQAAEAVRDDKELTKHIHSLFLYYEGASQPSRFHLLIAAALHQTHHCWQLGRDRGRNITDIDDETTPCLSIAFTTNFDRALERAFDELGVIYHVIYPVQRGEVLWLFKTVYRRGDTQRSFPEGGNCQHLTEDGFQSPDLPAGQVVPFAGPIVVKLHGSPLDPVSGPQRHWLVLSEGGYLDAMLNRPKAFPPWIDAQLNVSPGIPRSLWFLGYSVADWNIRLRLYEDLRRSLEPRGDNRPRPQKRIVDRPLDSFRKAIFGRLEIQLFVGDLNDLPGMIESALRHLSNERKLSPEVEGFLQRMRKRP
ncbi:MAG TPA: SIR2 family protein [Thermoanaerobaculia bacterium]|nr:SIR2 family protein [Thermoanaerobaculia bacterium]